MVPDVGRAAAAGTSRLYRSAMGIRDIARGLVLGVGREAWRFIKSDEERLRAFIASLDVHHFEARLRTLAHDIPVQFDSLQLTIDGQPTTQKVAEYVGALHAIAEEDVDFDVSAAEAAAVKEQVEKARAAVVAHIERGALLGLSYNVAYGPAYFHVANQGQKGHVRMDLSLLRSVRMFNGAAFTANLQTVDPGTEIHTSLWTDVCIGRREGPLVRRIAHREITCRQAQFLAQIEQEVQSLIHHPEQSRLSRMMPELIRRIAEG
jgi:hypothetical protein